VKQIIESKKRVFARLILIPLLLFIAVTLAGCTGIIKHKKVVEIHYLVWFPEEYTKISLGSRYVDAVSDFNLAHPNINVIIDYPSPRTEDNVKLMKSYDAPDVISWSINDLQSAADNNLLRDMSSLSANELDIPQSILDTGTINGELLILPYGSQPSGVFYNKDLFDAAKIPYPVDNWTWDQYRDISEKIAGDPSVPPYTINTLDTLLLSVGGAVLSPEGSTSQGYLDSADAVRMIQWLNSYYRETANARALSEDTESLIQFSDQRTGMYLGKLGMQFFTYQRSKINMGVAPLPYMDGGERVNPTTIMGYAIAKVSEHPEAAWEFIHYLTMENNVYSLKIAEDYLPTSKTLAEAAQVDSDPILSVFNKELPFAGRSSFEKNAYLFEVLNGDFTKQFQKLQEAGDDQIANLLHSLAQKLDQELNQIKQVKLNKLEKDGE
jgi:multiple sugar transport system substrate-binding protein